MGIDKLIIGIDFKNTIMGKYYNKRKFICDGSVLNESCRSK